MRWKSISFVIAAVELSKYPMTDHIFAIAEATRGMFFCWYDNIRRGFRSGVGSRRQ